MRHALPLLFAVSLLPAAITSAAAQTPPPPHAGPLYIATYVEVVGASVKDGVKLLQQYRDASRKENGNMRAEVAQEMGRPARFIVIETWKDQAAFDAHGKAASTAAFRDKLKAIHAAPNDERAHNMLNGGGNDPIAGKQGVIVASHVDVPPPRKDDLIAALNPLADGSRKGAGNQRFEVQQQTSRPNHFTVVEVWKDKKAYEAGRSAGTQRQFRDKLGPMLGALYDERLYQMVN